MWRNTYISVKLQVDLCINVLNEHPLQLQSMMSNNHKVVDIERLAHHEFDLDMEEQNRLQAEGDAEVARVRAVCKRGGG